jgi:hypothetical protein
MRSLGQIDAAGVGVMRLDDYAAARFAVRADDASRDDQPLSRLVRTGDDEVRGKSGRRQQRHREKCKKLHSDDGSDHDVVLLFRLEDGISMTSVNVLTLRTLRASSQR